MKMCIYYWTLKNYVWHPFFYQRIVLVTTIQAENEKEQCSTCVIIFLLIKMVIVLTSIVEIKNA